MRFLWPCKADRTYAVEREVSARRDRDRAIERHDGMVSSLRELSEQLIQARADLASATHRATEAEDRANRAEQERSDTLFAMGQMARKGHD